MDTLHTGAHRHAHRRPRHERCGQGDMFSLRLSLCLFFSHTHHMGRKKLQPQCPAFPATSRLSSSASSAPLTPTQSPGGRGGLQTRLGICQPLPKQEQRALISLVPRPTHIQPYVHICSRQTDRQLEGSSPHYGQEHSQSQATCGCSTWGRDQCPTSGTKLGIEAGLGDTGARQQPPHPRTWLSPGRFC